MRNWGRRRRESDRRAPRGHAADFDLTDLRIEPIARVIRGAIAPGLPDDQALPGLELFEKLDELTVPIPGTNESIRLDYAVESLPAGVEGRTRYDEQDHKIVVVLSPETYKALRRGKKRARSTLFHEIAHAFLHVRLLIRLSHIPHYEAELEMALNHVLEPTHARSRDTEWQANAVSAALLMPARGLAALERTSGVLGGYEVQARFKVSAESAGIRIRTYERHRTALVG